MTPRPHFLNLFAILLLSLFALQGCESSSNTSTQEAIAAAPQEANVDAASTEQASEESASPQEIAELQEAPGTQDPAPGNAGERTKEEDIRRLMQVLQMDQLGDQIMQQMIAMMRQNNPNLPADFMDRFSEVVDSSELLELLIPIYDRHLSQEDIVALTEFYLSEPGQNFIKVQGQISQEAMMVGQQWGQQAAMKVMNELQE